MRRAGLQKYGRGWFWIGCAVNEQSTLKNRGEKDKTVICRPWETLTRCKATDNLVSGQRVLWLPQSNGLKLSPAWTWVGLEDREVAGEYMWLLWKLSMMDSPFLSLKIWFLIWSPASFRSWFSWLTPLLPFQLNGIKRKFSKTKEERKSFLLPPFLF